MRTVCEQVTKRMLPAAMAVVVAAVAGCGGGEDRLSKEETARELNAAVQTVNGEFQRVFQELGRRAESERVPRGIRARLRKAAAVERRVTQDLEGIEPPAESERDVDRLVEAARKQADALDAAAGRDDLTVAELADTVELPAMRTALVALARNGLVKPPGHQP